MEQAQIARCCSAQRAVTRSSRNSPTLSLQYCVSHSVISKGTTYPRRPLSTWTVRKQSLRSDPRKRCTRHKLGLHAVGDDASTDVQAERSSPDTPTDGSSIFSSVLGIVLWAAFVGYALLLSPNQTPYRDMYFLEKLVGIGEKDGVQINAVFTQLFFIMGIWPAIYAALLIPSARSGNKIPAWPFVALSFGVGVFALGPYFALWTPSREALAPPKPRELEGWRNVGLKGTESSIGSWLILAGALVTVSQALLAGSDAWGQYLQLFAESRFVHVTSTDFAALCLFAPFWMWNDAEKRQWEGRKLWLTVLSFIPFLGPAIYLVLRPRAATNGSSE